MTQTIKLSLVKALIIENVKNETFLRGQVEKAADQKAIAQAYHEQAGNETYQERMLERALQTNLAELLTHFSDYLTSSGQSTGDNIIDLDDTDEKIIIYLTVSDRFNKGYTNPLAKLASKYIEEAMLMDWFKPIDEKKSALYAQFAEKELQSIRRCFNKTAPVAPVVPYTSFIKTYGSTIEMIPGEEATVTYEISDGAIDDIEVRADDKILVDTGRSEQGFTVVAKQRGHTDIMLYSRHNPDICKTLSVFITDDHC